MSDKGREEQWNKIHFIGLLITVCVVTIDSFDLLILREMLTKMGGIEVSEEITDQHLQAMCGGDLLRQEVSSYMLSSTVK